MARPKKAGRVLASVDECTAAMGELLTATLDEEAAVAERDLLLAKLQTQWEPRINAARRLKGELQQALQDYYYAHLREIEKDGVKHLKLPNGEIGRYSHPQKLAPLNRSWTWGRIKDLVKVVHGPKKFFLDRDPELDRDRIKAELAVEELKELGLKLEQDETFYAEPARPVPPTEGGA